MESHYDIQPVVDIFASPDQRDLGGLATDIEGIIAKARATLPRGTTIDLRGQVDTMETSFKRLGLGMIFAVVLVYLVMAVNFQSWLDPLAILTALAWSEWLANALDAAMLSASTSQCSGTYAGAIMGIGVATANSILLVTFANDEAGVGEKALSSPALAAGVHANPARYDDGTGDDHRHAPDWHSPSVKAASRTRHWEEQLSGACCSPPRQRCSSFRSFIRCFGRRRRSIWIGRLPKKPERFPNNERDGSQSEFIVVHGSLLFALSPLFLSRQPRFTG